MELPWWEALDSTLSGFWRAGKTCAQRSALLRGPKESCERCALLDKGDEGREPYKKPEAEPSSFNPLANEKRGG
jgi:hypothetical protein